jgi:hypothetical protein
MTVADDVATRVAQQIILLRSAPWTSFSGLDSGPVFQVKKKQKMFGNVCLVGCKPLLCTPSSTSIKGGLMGRKYIEDLIEEGWRLDLDSLIAIHLSNNHYPSVPAVMVKPCKEAILHAEQEALHELVQLPAGVMWRNQTSIKAGTLMDAFHLWSFLDQVQEA